MVSKSDKRIRPWDLKHIFSWKDIYALPYGLFN
jgi:hypothetical protein